MVAPSCVATIIFKNLLNFIGLLHLHWIKKCPKFRKCHKLFFKSLTYTKFVNALRMHLDREKQNFFWPKSQEPQEQDYVFLGPRQLRFSRSKTESFRHENSYHLFLRGFPKTELLDKNDHWEQSDTSFQKIKKIRKCVSYF